MIMSTIQNNTLIYFLLLVSICTGFSFNCPAQIPPPQNSNPPEGQLANSLLWRITENGLTDTSWLFGTIHLIGQRDFYVRPSVKASLQSSEQVAFELKLNDMSMLMSMNELLKLQGNETLEELLDPEQYRELTIWVEDSLGAKMEDFEHKKPFALLQLALQRLLPENPASYEFYLLQEAVSQEKEVFGLETMQDQMAVFDSIPIAEQIEWTLETLRNLDSMKGIWQELVRVYQRQDLNRLQQMIVEESPELRSHSEVLLNKRNEIWIDRISRLIAEKSTFIAVGAGHLGGEHGVIRLLQASGYTVEPILQ